MLIEDFWSQATDNIYFGAYPTQSMIDKVIAAFPNAYIVNLTQDKECLEGYTTPPGKFLSFPIRDNGTPAQDILTFTKFLARVSSQDTLFIHCKGGHGRSSMIAACVLCYKFRYEPEEALNIVMRAHRQRKILSERWRSRALCMHLCQRNFVYDTFLPVFIKKTYKYGNYNSFNSYSFHPIKYRGHTFHCVEVLYQALKDFDNEDYLTKLLNINERFAYLAKNIGEEHFIAGEELWTARRHEIMKFVYALKLEQYPQIKEFLMSTGAAPIIDISRNCHYGNLVGEVLWDLRNEFLIARV